MYSIFGLRDEEYKKCCERRNKVLRVEGKGFGSRVMRRGEKDDHVDIFNMIQKRPNAGIYLRQSNGGSYKEMRSNWAKNLPYCLSELLLTRMLLTQ